MKFVILIPAEETPSRPRIMWTSFGHPSALLRVDSREMEHPLYGRIYVWGMEREHYKGVLSSRKFVRREDSCWPVRRRSWKKRGGWISGILAREHMPPCKPGTEDQPKVSRYSRSISEATGCDPPCTELSL